MHVVACFVTPHHLLLLICPPAMCLQLPTILLGCLPTYSQIGIAAPVLMALLRFVSDCSTAGAATAGSSDSREQRQQLK